MQHLRFSERIFSLWLPAAEYTIHPPMLDPCWEVLITVMDLSIIFKQYFRVFKVNDQKNWYHQLCLTDEGQYEYIFMINLKQ